MNCGSKIPSASTVSLPEIPKGRKVRVYSLDGESIACQRLREMGFCEDAEVKVLTNNGSMVCQVCGSKVGLSKQVANAVIVEPVS